MRFKISDLSFKGFSLIEVMIVLGLLGGVATIVMSLTKQTASTQKKFQTDIDADFIVKEISGFLANSDNCSNSEIKGKNASTTAAGSITKVKNYKADSVTSYGSSNIKVESFALSNTNFDEIYDKTTETSLVINFNMPKIVSTTVPTIKPRRIKLVITKTGANVETCMSAWVNQQDYWTKILSTNDIFYTGKVGVGRVPTESFHVAGPSLPKNFNIIAKFEGNNTGVGADHVVISSPSQSRLTISGKGEDYVGGKATYSSLVLENSANLQNHWFIAYKGGASANLPKDGLTIGKYNSGGPKNSNNNLPFSILNITKEGFVGLNTVAPIRPLHVMGGIVSEAVAGKASYSDATGICSISSLLSSPLNGGCIGSIVTAGDYGGIGTKAGDFSISSTQSIQFVPGLAGWTPTVAKSGLVAMTILSNGKIGMNVLAPTANLDVNADAKIGTMLTVGGNVTVGGIVTSNSDERLKKDFASIPHALEKILSFKGIFYRWKDESKGKNLQLGFKAQEVEKVFPEVVSTDDKGFKSVAYQNLIAPVVEAIRELYNKITSALVLLGEHDLEIEKLKNENVELRAALCEISPKLKICQQSRQNINKRSK